MAARDTGDVRIFTEERDSLTAFLRSNADGSYYVGHACVLVRVNGRKYLFDPVTQRPLLLDSWLYFPPQIMDRRLLDVDGVFISHFHEDHFDPRFLACVDPRTPVHMCSDRALLADLLREAGIEPQMIPPKCRFNLHSNVNVYAMPSDYNRIDSSFLIRGDNFGVYQGNDNFISAETLSEGRRVLGDIDHAYVPYAYIWWYPFCLASIDAKTRSEEGSRLVHKYLNLGLEHARVLDSPVVVPCGGNLVYFNATDAPINEAIYAPCDFFEYARTAAPDVASRMFPIAAGDFVLKESGVNRVFGDVSTQATYRARMKTFLETWNAHNPGNVPAAHVLQDADLEFLRKRLAKADFTAIDCVIVVEREGAAGAAISVDLAKRRVERGVQIEPGRHWVRFELDARAFTAWLKEEVIFEVVLESARFAVRRWPEVHEPKVWEVLRLHF